MIYSTTTVRTDWPEIGYAILFSSIAIVKVIAVQIVGSNLR